MSTSNPTTGPSRAQGNQRLPWPSEFSGTPSDCLIGLRVEVTDDLPDGDVEPISDTGAIAVGDPSEGLCSLARIARGLEPDQRPTLIGEVRALGGIDPGCPLKIERVFFRDGRTVHVEATVLPVSDTQLDELTTLMSEEADQSDSHSIGLLYLEQARAGVAQRRSRRATAAALARRTKPRRERHLPAPQQHHGRAGSGARRRLNTTCAPAAPPLTPAGPRAGARRAAARPTKGDPLTTTSPTTHATGAYVKPSPDTAPGHYYTTVLRARRWCLALGPFTDDHARALAGVERVRGYFRAHRLDDYHDCAFGTARLELDADAPQGKLNDALLEPSDSDVAAFLAAHPPRPGRHLICQPEQWPFRVVEIVIDDDAYFQVLGHDRSVYATYTTFADAERDRRFRTTPSTRYDLLGTGAGRLRLERVGDPRHMHGYPASWVRLARINRRPDATQERWLIAWVKATHTLVAQETP